MPDARGTGFRIGIVAVVALVVGVAGGVALGLGLSDDGDEPIPRAATPAVADIRIEGDDTALKELLVGLRSAGSDSTFELVAGELPADFPETFPPPPGATLLGGETSSYAMSPGVSGSAVYRSDQAPEAALDAVVEVAEAADWWEPELPDYYPVQREVFTAQFCQDDWARTGLAVNVSATPDGAGGSYINIRYFQNQGGSQCDPDAYGPRGGDFKPPRLLDELQRLRPEGAEPDFRFNNGISGSNDSFAGSTGFRFDGSALTVARFYQREFDALEDSDVTTVEPAGDESSAIFQVSTVEASGEEERTFIGWLMVTRFEDDEEPEAPVIKVELMLAPPPDGLTGGVSGSIAVIQGQ